MTVATRCKRPGWAERDRCKERERDEELVERNEKKASKIPCLSFLDNLANITASSARVLRFFGRNTKTWLAWLSLEKLPSHSNKLDPSGQIENFTLISNLVLLSLWIQSPPAAWSRKSEAVFRMLAYFGFHQWVTLASKMFGRIIFRSGQFSANLSSIFQGSTMASLVQNAAGDWNLSRSCWSWRTNLQRQQNQIWNQRKILYLSIRVQLV